ncbi:hypothetical protein Dsin_019596 [Dipteronia sinensis]|uniref:Uncharacterized protein n=1 Tax=Dipteronia sinensis TaxID=43782 RepID=A0AAE0A7U7_9ROSI|nr:hypothetical protein Dsin_019596 [Dipteronia sinensis]
MTGPVLVPSRSITKRCPPLLTAEKNNSSIPKSTKDEGRHHEHNKKGKKFGEVAGGTAAECAAVCCCCPFTVMNLLVLAVYKVPTGLCKKAWGKQRKRHRIMGKKRKQVGGLLMGPTCGGVDGAQKQELLVTEKNDKDADLELEKEMWDQFRGTGFWRSPSQKEPETGK